MITKRNPGCSRCGYELGCFCKPRPPARDRRRLQPEQPRAGATDLRCDGKGCVCDCPDSNCLLHMYDSCYDAENVP